MSVFSFDHHDGLTSTTRPLALASLRRVRWAMILAVSVNLALWTAIGFGAVALLQRL